MYFYGTMKSLLLYNLEYDAWANTAWARTLQNREAVAAVPKVAVWMSHILLASRIWAERAEGLSVTQNAWEALEPEFYAEIIRENAQRWEILLDREVDSGNRVIVYQNLQGRQFEMPLYQLVTHLSHHGAYHRGQMASALKAAGFEVPATDAILYARLF
jgi:uncharacterized damage-inducible protein DinB